MSLFKVNKLISRLAQYNQEKPVNMFLAFRCTTMDIITSYCFAHCVDSLDAEDFYDPLLVTIQTTAPFIWVMKLLPFLVSLVSALPEKFDQHVNSQFIAFLADRGLLENTENPTIYHRLLNAPSGKATQATPSRRDLLEEALSLLQAGSDTVGNTCTIGTFYALNDPAVHSKLYNELCEAWPDKDTPIGYTVLEKLPYLVGAVPN
jgi:cytochrome P450